MYKKILVPTDGSEFSRRAFIAALDLAKKYGSEVELFHVVYTPRNYGGDGYTYMVPQENIDRMGEEALKATTADIDTDGVSVEKKFIEGYPSIGIMEEMKNGFELVVMGSRGHGALAGAILGSVPLHILAHTKCPVLVVK